MSTHRSHHLRRFPQAAALDAGLSVCLPAPDGQGAIFAGASSLPIQPLASELSLLVSRLRIRSFSLRSAIEEVTTALLHNVECGFWLPARDAALDLSGFLRQARRGRLADAESCLRGANAAMRLADLCWREVR
jgi:hypothetical protein